MARTLPARPPSQRARSVPAKYFRAECGTLERTVTSMGLVTADGLAAARPGGIENPDTGAFGWLQYYRHLHRMHARGSSAEGSAPRGSPPPSETIDDEIVLAALREDPLVVELVDSGSAAPRSLVVRPLSEHALVHLDARDDLLRCLATHAHGLQASQRPEDHVVRLQLVDEIAYQQALCVWICTSDVAPRLPFDPRITPRPEVPATLRELHPLDTVRVQAAHHRLNAVALTVARRLVSLPDDPQQRGGSWRTFFSTLEQESNGTVPAAQFMRDRALVGLLAARIIAADAEAKAYERAKAAADKESTTRR